MTGVLLTKDTREIRDPTWPQIQDALLELDGDHLNEVTVTLEDMGSLIIGGGNGQRYIVVYIPEDDLEEAYSVTVVDESLTGPDVTLTVQTAAEYPARMAVSLPLVLQAVEQFYRTSRLPENVYWEP
jgi:hypothetical protein